MATDDLDPSKKTLEDGIDCLGSWMIGFIWPVAIGLFIEFYAVLDFAWTHDWNSLIDRLGLLLVTVGVSGELLVEHKTHRSERKLRGVNAEMEQRSDLKLKAADERIAELTFKSEQERLARAKIELRLRKSRNRYLSEEEQEVLKHIVRAYKGQEFFIITPTPEYGMFSEPDRFGSQLEQVLKSQGWTSTSPTSQSVLGQRYSSRAFLGVQIIYGLQSGVAAGELHKALDSFDIFMRPIIQDGSRPLTLLVIDIGLAA